MLSCRGVLLGHLHERVGRKWREVRANTEVGDVVAAGERG